MASIRKEFSLNVSADRVWDVLRDFGAVHTRLAPGFVTDTKLEGNIRIVTFANGSVAREELVTLDDAHHRLVYMIRSERLQHHNASAEVIPDGTGCRFVWTTDVLPDEIAPYISGQMDAGVEAMRKAINE
jgi:Polyketide cyclase / dehydrase and lipid transport